MPLRPKTIRRQSYRHRYAEQVDANRKLRDRFIGTVMLLAYDGCISEGRARELVGLDGWKWRRELIRLTRDAL